MSFFKNIGKSVSGGFKNFGSKTSNLFKNPVKAVSNGFNNVGRSLSVDASNIFKVVKNPSSSVSDFFNKVKHSVSVDVANFSNVEKFVKGRVTDFEVIKKKIEFLPKDYEIFMKDFGYLGMDILTLVKDVNHFIAKNGVLDKLAFLAEKASEFIPVIGPVISDGVYFAMKGLQQLSETIDSSLQCADMIKESKQMFDDVNKLVGQVEEAKNLANRSKDAIGKISSIPDMASKDVIVQQLKTTVGMSNMSTFDLLKSTGKLDNMSSVELGNLKELLKQSEEYKKTGTNQILINQQKLFDEVKIQEERKIMEERKIQEDKKNLLSKKLEDRNKRMFEARERQRLFSSKYDVYKKEFTSKFMTESKDELVRDFLMLFGYSRSIPVSTPPYGWAWDYIINSGYLNEAFIGLARYKVPTIDKKDVVSLLSSRGVSPVSSNVEGFITDIQKRYNMPIVIIDSRTPNEVKSIELNNKGNLLSVDYQKSISDNDKKVTRGVDGNEVVVKRSSKIVELAKENPVEVTAGITILTLALRGIFNAFKK